VDTEDNGFGCPLSMSPGCNAASTLLHYMGPRFLNHRWLIPSNLARENNAGIVWSNRRIRQGTECMTCAQEGRMCREGTASELEKAMGTAFPPGKQYNLFHLQAHNIRADTEPDLSRDWHKLPLLCTKWAQKNSQDRMSLLGTAYILHFPFPQKSLLDIKTDPNQADSNCQAGTVCIRQSLPWKTSHCGN